MSLKKAKIYTRTGDRGHTGLFGGSRVEKDAPRVEAYGTLDELGASIALVKTFEVDPSVRPVLDRLENDLYQMGAEVAADPKGRARLDRRVTAEDVAYLERLIDEFDAQLPALTDFIVPVQKQSAAALNLARTVCRRAERRLWTLAHGEPVNDQLITLVNRLSDLLFTLMRFEGRDQGTQVIKDGGKVTGHR